MSKPPIEIEHINNVTISISGDIQDRAELAIASGSMITVVEDPADEQSAVSAIKDIKAIISEVEKARQVCKRPFLDKGRELDRIAQEFITPLADEQRRIQGVMTAYTVEQNRIRREAEQKRLEELRAIEEEKRKAEEALKKAQTVEEKQMAATVVQAAIQERKEVTQAPKPVESPKGLSVRKEYRVEVVDADALYKARPDLCELKPRLAMIKEAVKAGAEIPGVTFTIQEIPVIR